MPPSSGQAIWTPWSPAIRLQKSRAARTLTRPAKKTGLRPDRATIVYANRVREAFPELPVVIGGLEASLRRFAHYDYWEDKVRRPFLFDAKADLLIYGMGEKAVREIASRLSHSEQVSAMTDIRGTACFLTGTDACRFPIAECASYEEVASDKRKYAEATMLQYDEHDPVRGKAVLQRCGDRLLSVNPPQLPLTAREFDKVSELPYTREVHPMYETLGGVAAIEEVRFSVIHNRGCFGACNFCSLAFHQGRMVTSRSHDSVLREVEAFSKHPEFKGYVHDVGGPTANFRGPSCRGQLTNGLCRGKNCLTPEPCQNLEADHSDYLKLLRRISAVPGVKKVFVAREYASTTCWRIKTAIFSPSSLKTIFPASSRSPRSTASTTCWILWASPGTTSTSGSRRNTAVSTSGTAKSSFWCRT